MARIKHPGAEASDLFEIPWDNLLQLIEGTSHYRQLVSRPSVGDHVYVAGLGVGRVWAMPGGNAACQVMLGHVPDEVFLAEGKDIGLVIGHPKLIIAYDPAIVSPDQYARLIKALGNLARAEGAAGLMRLVPEEVDDGE